jgi:hypothetical protein
MQFEFSRQFPKYIPLDRVTFPTTYIYFFVHFYVHCGSHQKQHKRTPLGERSSCHLDVVVAAHPVNSTFRRVLAREYAKIMLGWGFF